MKSQNEVQNEAKMKKPHQLRYRFRNNKSKISLSSTGKNTALKVFYLKRQPIINLQVVVMIAN